MAKYASSGASSRYRSGTASSSTAVSSTWSYSENVLDGGAASPSPASRRQVAARSSRPVPSSSARPDRPSQYASSAHFSSRRGPTRGYPSTVAGPSPVGGVGGGTVIGAPRDVGGPAIITAGPPPAPYPLAPLMAAGPAVAWRYCKAWMPP